MSMPDDEDRTVFLPGSSGMPSQPSWNTAPAGPTAPPPLTAATVAPFAPRREGSGIQVGDVLNHIFEVRRFIARGGMGEVFEGVNINSDERVAIKVMLPALAADPNIQAMFRKEARTLTRLSNPALVQYRVLAQEPQLGIFYIVTEYIDGANLCDRLGAIHPTADELIELTKRLATGLAVAHALGAIHRDISPDNVLLEDGRLDRAKIIDFGIAKDLDPGEKTIVGDGFAGKLGYVAPEQLGDFDRVIGSWTDVYSLGLVILAVATGGNPDVSGSFVEAIEKRRRGPDLTAVAPSLRPVLAQMLEPDPAKRLRSMEAVLEALRAPPPPPVSEPAGKEKPRREKTAASRPEANGNKRTLVLGAAGGGIALLAVAGFLAFGGSRPDHAVVPVAVSGPPPAAAQDKVAAEVTRALPGIACSWLDLTAATSGPGGVTARLAGAAGNPAAAQAAVAEAVAAGGSQLVSSDFSEVAPIDRNECQSIDAFRAIRASGTAHLSVAQRKFEMSRLPDDSAKKGQIGARVVLNLDLGDPKQDFALYGIEPSGEVSALIPDRKTFTAIPKTGPIADLGGDHYRLQADADHSGWSGFVLLTGKGGFRDSLVVTKTGKRAANWPQQFAQAAAANGWKAEMVWFKMVDELPN